MADIKVLGLSLYGSLAASHRIRLSQYKAGLLGNGIDLKVQALLGNTYLRYRFNAQPFPICDLVAAFFKRLRLLLTTNQYDLIIVHCELIPFLPAWLETALLRIPYIYDFDDAWYLRYQAFTIPGLRCMVGNKFGELLTRASAVTAGNNHLAKFASQFNSNVTVLPSVIDSNVFRRMRVRKDLGFTIGWIGSSSTEKYLEVLVEPLSKLAQESTFRFVVIGGKAPESLACPVLELHWSEDSEVELINTFDVGVMPLPDDEWTKGKCAFKLVQYMACGLPVIASRVGANIDLVTKDCGVLVDTANEWIGALRWMQDNPIQRLKMGAIGRARIEKDYSLLTNLPKLVGVIRSVARGANI
jgi:glycosyltransferase involved in cell wall biosynthesis